MTKLMRAQLIELVETHYFGNVDAKRLEPALACFHPDATLSIQTAGASHTGAAAIRRMFTDFFGSTRTIYHGDYSHVIDVEAQRIASQFVARNAYDDGRKVEMRNCNFFVLKDGRFAHVTIYMSGANPLV
jgi:ketosteroid isomerase-like protein